MPEPAELAERDQRTPGTLAKVFGTGDMRAMIEATKDNVGAAIEFAEQREFVSRYPIMRQGRKVGERLWFHHPTWQLLGMSFGITAYTEGEPTEVKPGLWQAAAVAASVETGVVVGRAVGLCSKNEPGKAKVAEHTLAAQAQTRAQRNALRSALGAALIAAGFEVADPEGPATREQLAKLHVLEREIGMDHDEGHAMAGVDSYTKLTRDQASDVIERWEAMRAELSDSPDAGQSDAGSPGETDTTEPSAVLGEGAHEAPSDLHPGGPTIGGNVEVAWQRAPKNMTRVAAIKLAKRLVDEGRMPGPAPTSQSAFTAEQVGAVSRAFQDGER